MTFYGLHITRCSLLSLYGFTNVDRPGNVDDHNFTGAYLVYFGNTVISWKSSKQRIVVRFSTKAEYKVLANGVNPQPEFLGIIKILNFSPRLKWVN
jgi:hypothetical protein